MKALETLERKGSRLHGQGRQWSMTAVHGPLPDAELAAAQERQYFRIETTGPDILFVYRGRGERGMRRLHLVAVSAQEATLLPLAR